MGQVLTKNEGFSVFCEGWLPFLLEIKQKAGWLVGMVSSLIFWDTILHRVASLIFVGKHRIITLWDTILHH